MLNRVASWLWCAPVELVHLDEVGHEEAESNRWPADRHPLPMQNRKSAGSRVV